MTKRQTWFFAALFFALLARADMLRAQDPLDRDSFNVPEGNWNADDNWVDSDGELSFPPSLEFERWALINNGGTAIVDDAADTGRIQLDNGTVDIRQGGSMVVEETFFTDGLTSIGSNGTLRLSGNGSFTGLNVTNRGTIHLDGPEASFEATGDISTTGNLALNITDAGTPKLTAGGEVTVGGTVSPTFSGVEPQFGDSFEFASGGSVVNRNAEVQVPENVTLGRGLEMRVDTDADSASLTFGNLPILQVDRATGAGKIMNVVGGPITMTGYSIKSDRGLLDAGFSGLNAQGVEGWEAPNPQATSLSEVNLTGEATLNVDESVDLGKAYNGGATHPLDEDVTFVYSTPNGSILAGAVEYTGAPNDLVLNLNPETGEATLYNRSQFIDPPSLTGYSILSASGSLQADEWTSFADGGDANWTEANPQATIVSELNLMESNEFVGGTTVSLGNIFNTGGERDVVLEYTTPEALLIGTVQYLTELPPWTGGGGGVAGDCNQDGVVDAGDLACVSTIQERDAVLAAIPTLAGDLDGNGDVGFPDFLTLSANFGQNLNQYTAGDIDLSGDVGFPDFLTLSSNFGQTPSATAAAVPEPTGLSLLGLGGGLMLGLRRRRRREQRGPTPTAASMLNRNNTMRNACLLLLSMLAASLGSAVHADTIGAGLPLEDQASVDGWSGIQTLYGHALPPAQVVNVVQYYADDDRAAAVEDGLFKLFPLIVKQENGSIENGDGIFSIYDIGPIHIPEEAGAQLFPWPGGSLPIPDDAALYHPAVLEWQDGTNNTNGGLVSFGDNGPGMHFFDVDTTNFTPDDIGPVTVGYNLTDDSPQVHTSAAGGRRYQINFETGEPSGTIPEDINQDEVVDAADFLIMLENFHMDVPRGQNGDVNFSGYVDLTDFVRFRSTFEAAQQGVGAAIPEPGALFSLLLGGGVLLGLIRRGRRCTRGTLLTGLALTASLALCSRAYAQAEFPLEVFAGEISNVTGPNDIESIRFPENVVYAVNVWGEEKERVVNGVTFYSDREDVNPDLDGLDGYRHDWTHNVTNWQSKPDFGDSESDDNLEEIMSDIRWTDNSAGGDTGVGSHFAVTPNTQYTLELLISGNHDENRIWDIYLEDEMVVSEFDSTNYEDYDPGVVYSWKHTFFAPDDEISVTFNQERRPGIDGNAILQAAILTLAGGSVTPGDFNEDGNIDTADFQILVTNFATEGASFFEGDINFDRKVNLTDFFEFRAAFHGGQGQASPVPEPGSLSLWLGMAAGGGLLVRRRRRRQNIT